MNELLTAAQMRAIKEAAIASGEVTGLELMERAGRGVVDAIFEEWPEMARTPGRAVVLCGPGNNGGDGFVVARLLKGQGWDVEVFLYGDEAKLPPDAATNCRRWREMGEVSALPEGFLLPTCDLHVDALFGSGASRPLDEAYSYTLAYLHKHNPHFRAIAVDIPSCLCSDSGRELRVAGKADLTVTYHRQMRGHFLGSGPELCGRLRIVDIGLGRRATRSLRSFINEINDPERIRPSGAEIVEEIEKSEKAWNSVLRQARCDRVALAKQTGDLRGGGHKYTHGHALILSGGVGKGGAARLAARGALRIGAGLVTVGCPPAAVIENAAQLDAIMLRPVAGPDALVELLGDARINALCLGPGMGVGERTRALVLAALAQTSPPTPLLGGEGGGPPPSRWEGSRGGGLVLDADALTSFEGEAETLFAALHENCVLTPHAGEFARLFPDIATKLAEPATKGPAYSKVDATREAAARAGCVVLLKGADTVIAAPDGRCAINSAHYDRAAPWLATAGSGDVLAGFITGLLARGFGPMQAAETAAWLHVDCALSFGPGLIAEDLPEELPKVFRKLGV